MKSCIDPMHTTTKQLLSSITNFNALTKMPTVFPDETIFRK